MDTIFLNYRNNISNKINIERSDKLGALLNRSI